jgi:hypothetical protein
VPVALAGLTRPRLVRIEDGRSRCCAPTSPVRRDHEQAEAASTGPRAARRPRPRRTAASSRAGTRPAPASCEDVGPLDGELSAGGNALQLLTALIDAEPGDLLFLRPTPG